jgi:hypothetical protein
MPAIAASRPARRRRALDLGGLLFSFATRTRRQTRAPRGREPMIYVHVAENHRREILPAMILPAMIEASLGEADPDRRVLKMLGARGKNRGG